MPQFKSIVNSKRYVCVQWYKDMIQDAQKYLRNDQFEEAN